jgi:hypothetical protein
MTLNHVGVFRSRNFIDTSVIRGSQMKSLKSIAAGVAIAGALGFGAIGVGSGVASAAPVPGGQFAQDPDWGHGHGHGWDNDGGWRGDDRGRWAPPYYGYGGYGPPCVSGPLGFVQVSA